MLFYTKYTSAGSKNGYGDFTIYRDIITTTTAPPKTLYKTSEQKWVNDAFNDFRHAWFTLFTDNPISNCLTCSDLWSIYKKTFRKMSVQSPLALLNKGSPTQPQSYSLPQ